MAALGPVAPGNIPDLKPTLILAAAFILPAMLQPLLGWITGMLGVPVFYFMTTLGEERFRLVLRNSLLLIAAVSLIFYPIIPALLFALTLVPLGIILARCGMRGESGVNSGFYGILTLAGTWFLFALLYGLISGVNPYTQGLAVLDHAMVTFYKLAVEADPNMSPEVILSLEQVVAERRDFVPRIMPGLLVTMTVITVWLNLMGSMVLLRRLQPKMTVWPPYRTWQLPYPLIWGLISAGLFVLVGGEGLVADLGASLLLVTGTLYFLQGLAVLIHFMGQWHIPRFVKIFIYLIVVVQQIGFLLLAVVGVAEIWLNLRRITAEDHPSDN